MTYVYIIDTAVMRRIFENTLDVLLLRETEMVQ